MHSDRPKLSMRHSLSDALRNGAELCQRSAAKTRVNCGRVDALQGTKGSPQRHPRARSICKGNHAPMHTVGRPSGYRRSGSWLLRQMVPGFCHRRFWASATDVVKPANAPPSLASFFDVPRWGRSEKGAARLRRSDRSAVLDWKPEAGNSRRAVWKRKKGCPRWWTALRIRAADGIRTHDNHVGNVMLCQLSYSRIRLTSRKL